MLRTASVAGLAGLVVVTAVAGMVRGGEGALSAALAAMVVAGFFVLGHLGMTAVVAGSVGLSMASAFVLYLGQLIVLVAVFLVLRAQPWLDGPTFAAAAVVETLAWQVGQIVGFRRARHEVFPDVRLPGDDA
jgi:uncharacterized membrane protein